MSNWTDFRDGLQALGTIFINAYYPGAGAVIGPFTSQGAQQHLYGDDLGRYAMLMTGLAGGLAGNFANYGDTLSWLSGGSGAAGGASLVGAAEGTLATDASAMAQAKVLMDQGVPASEAFMEVGIAPGETFANTGAQPVFAGQDMAGAYGNLGTSAFNTGAPFNSTGVAGAGNSLGGNAAAPGVMSAASGAGAMPWGSPSNVASLLQSASGLFQASTMKDRSAQADPFAPYRKEYAERLARLSADPSLLQNEPGYQAGLQAVQRSMAAQGYTGSGNMMAAIAKYGGDFYNKTADRYAQYAGAGVNPGAAAQLGLAQDQYKGELMRRSIGNLGFTGQMAGGWPGR